jgi:hypothetical protein
MPSFTTKNGCYFVSYITGPSHVKLGVRFTDRVAEPGLIKQPAKGSCFHGLLDEDRIRTAVQDGIAAFQGEGMRLYVEEIIYVENDSPRYDLYRAAAYSLIKHYASGGEFQKEV